MPLRVERLPPKSKGGKRMKVSEYVQLIMAVGIVVATVVGAYYQNWSLVGASITGAFALLNGNRSTNLKGDTDEKPTDVPASPPVS